MYNIAFAWRRQWDFLHKKDLASRYQKFTLAWQALSGFQDLTVQLDRRLRWFADTHPYQAFEFSGVFDFSVLLEIQRRH